MVPPKVTKNTTLISLQIQVHHKNYKFWIHCLKPASDLASYIDGVNVPHYVRGGKCAYYVSE